MESLGRLFQICIEFMKHEFTFEGVTFSFWSIFLLLAVVEIICLLIGGFFSGK